MDKIRVGIPFYDESLLDRLTTQAAVYNVTNLLAEPLVRMYDGKAQPALAKSWQVFDGGKRWLFYLTPNTLFSDHTPCTMADVVESIQFAANAENEYGLPGFYQQYFENFDFRVLNRYALEVTCNQPSGDLAEILSGIMIIKPDRFGKRVIGTGNYKYANYWNNRSVRLTKLNGLKHLSAYEQITFFIIPEAAARLDALRRGEIHLAANLADVYNPYAAAEDPFSWFKVTTNRSIAGLLNGFKPPFNDPRARLAVNLAVDKEAIIRDVKKGLGIPATTVVSPYHCGYPNALRPIPYNPADAKRLFSEVGINRELVISVMPGFPNRSVEIAEAVIRYLQEAGVSARLDIQRNQTEYLRSIRAKETADISLVEVTDGSTYRILRDYVCENENGTAWQGIRDERLERMIDAAHTESDVTDRERKYNNPLTYLNQHPQWLYLFHPISVFAGIPEAHDVELLHCGVFRFPGAW